MNDNLSFYVQRYFLTHLINQHNYGANAITSYRDTFWLLLTFIEQSGKDISTLKVTMVDNVQVPHFLQWLESNRKNSMSTRNVRVAHLKSFFDI